jgi:excisionase family DNA binding protein
MEQTVYSVKELAALWRCSASAVYDLLTNGKLQGFKIGPSWRITDEARRTYEQTPVIPPSPLTKAAKRSAVLRIS